MPTLAEQVADLEQRLATLENFQAKELEPVLVELIARIAQHACRQGESGGRSWPHLHTLPYRESWRCVGEIYAREVALAVVLAIRPPDS